MVEQFGLAALYLFGSVARGKTHSESDVDLLAEFAQPVGLLRFIELHQRLEALLGCKVDLGTLRSLKPHMKEQVLREAIRIL